MNHTALPSRPTLISRFQRHVTARAEARRNGEAGLALLDVLLGMAIFGIIVIIGIQSVNQFRQRAFETTATSDAQQLSIGLESYFTDNQAYPANTGTATAPQVTLVPPAATTMTAAEVTAQTTATQLLGVNLSRNVTVRRYTPNNATGTFTMCLVHRSGGLADTNIDAWASYNSAVGAIDGSGRGTLPAAPAGVGCD